MLCLGNPIVRNDQVGLLVGERIARRLGPESGIEVRQFTGPPLALLHEIGCCAQLLMVDAISTGSSPIGSVVLLTEEDLARASGDFFPHGVNLADVLALGRGLHVPLPSRIWLIGIEVGPIQEFGETPSPELADRMEDIGAEALRIVQRLLETRREKS